MQTTKTKTLVTCAMLIALAAMLSVFPKFDGIWPNGGSITVCSMLPIIIISYVYGMKWGFMSSAVFAVIQIMTGLKGIAAGDLIATLGVLFLDYIAAYFILGIGGIFKGKFNNQATELSLGALVALLARFVCHFFSGYILFGSYASWFFSQEGFSLGNNILNSLGEGQALYMLYSFMYNASYMLPEILMTCFVAYAIGKTNILEKIS